MGTNRSIARPALAAALALGLAASADATQVVLGVTVAQSPASPASGAPVSYLITVENTGDEVVTDLLVVDTVAPQVTGAATDQDATGFPGGPVVTQGASGSIYAWSATGLTMAPGAVYTFTITGAAGVTCGPAWVGATAWAGASGASTAGEASGAASGFGLAPALAVNFSQTFISGRVDYAIQVVNTGTATVMDLVITGTLPPSAAVFSTTEPFPFGPPAVTSVPGSGTLFTWSAVAAAFAPYASLTINLSATPTCVSVSMTSTLTAMGTASTGCGTAATVSTPQVWTQTAGTVVSTAPHGWAGDSWVVLTWTASAVEDTSGTVDRYQVWRSEDGSNYAAVGTAAAGHSGVLYEKDTRAFWDRTVANGVSYSYRLQALTACGASAFSDPPAVVAPMTSSALTDSGKSGVVTGQPGDTYVKLSWPSNPYPEPTVSRYSIYRSTGAGGPFAAIPSSPIVNAGSSIDNLLVNMQAYWYMMVPCCPERRPSFLSVTPYKPASGHGRPVARMDPSGPRAVRIAWTAGTTGTYGISGYAVFRSDDGGSTLNLIGTVPAGQLWFVDLTVPTYGKRYLYIVRPVDALGNLGESYPTTLIDVVLPTNRTFLNRNRLRPARGERLEIAYQITERGRLRVSVWTQAGELVRKLIDQDQQGSYTVDTPFNSHNYGLPPLAWDGTNSGGELVASGVYFVVLEVNGKRDFRTVAVIR